jgi:hypothetical protein
MSGVTRVHVLAHPKSRGVYVTVTQIRNHSQTLQYKLYSFILSGASRYDFVGVVIKWNVSFIT